MNNRRRFIPVLLLLALPLAAQAKSWLLPSLTVLPDPGWITVYAATSDEYFFLNRGPLGIETLSIAAPDGTRVEPQNSSSGKLRNSFDLQLTQTGTYRITVTSDSINGRSHHNWLRWPNTTPILRALRSRSCHGTDPATSTTPLVGTRMPVSILMVVDFPAPLGPR